MATMKIEFINHACIRVETAGRNLLCDPWLEGRILNDSWNLLSASAPVDFSQIDYIWISHEHPDHLHFPSLKKIPDEDKQRIKVLTQKHGSSRVADAISKMGFKFVVELPLMQWIPLAPGLEVYCASIGMTDSCLAVRSEGRTIFNLNDCIVNDKTLRFLKSKIGKIDFLFMQFSFAIWAGNESDEIGEATRKIRQLKIANEIFQPEFNVPFASFSYFCNEENKRMNSWANTPEKVLALGIPGLNFMYPGDLWDSTVGTFESQRAVERYNRDRANIKIDPTPATKSLGDVEKAAAKFLSDFKASVPAMLVRRCDPLAIFITDLEVIVTVDVRANKYWIEKVSEQNEKARFKMCSQMAWHLLNFDWGASNLEVSGMYHDREYIQKGQHLALRYRTQFATRALDLSSLTNAKRSLEFFWKKRVEIWHRLTSKPQPPASEMHP